MRLRNMAGLGVCVVLMVACHDWSQFRAQDGESSVDAAKDAAGDTTIDMQDGVAVVDAMDARDAIRVDTGSNQDAQDVVAQDASDSGCGAQGQPCCANGMACVMFAQCRNQMCVACGLSGGACCPTGQACRMSGQMCRGQTCR